MSEGRKLKEAHMRNFKVDWLRGSDKLRLSERNDQGWEKAFLAKPVEMAEFLLKITTNSPLIVAEFSERFSIQNFSARNSFPRYLDENLIRAWVEKQLGAKI
jgi:hypothetical protein